MPIFKLDAEKIAVAHLLHRDNWTHGRIAAVLGVERTTVTYALNKRKTRMPGAVDQMAAEIMARALVRTHEAVSKAMAASLRSVADRLDAERMDNRKRK